MPECPCGHPTWAGSVSFYSSVSKTGEVDPFYWTLSFPLLLLWIAHAFSLEQFVVTVFSHPSLSRRDTAVSTAWGP